VGDGFGGDGRYAEYFIRYLTEQRYERSIPVLPPEIDIAGKAEKPDHQDGYCVIGVEAGKEIRRIEKE